MRSFLVRLVNKAKEKPLVRIYFSSVLQIHCDHLVIGTGQNTFFGRAAKLVGDAHDEIGHLQTILAKIGDFCIIAIGIFLIAEIIVM